MRVFLAISILVFFTTKVSAQDVHFSQFYENASLRNPALTGIFTGDYKVGANYRSQWSSVDANPFNTILASGEAKIGMGENSSDFFSVGATVVYDRSGSIDFTTAQIYPAINYNKFLEGQHNTYLSMGFTCGYIQRTLDPSKMTFANQYQNGSYSSANSSRENLTYAKTQNIDLGAGLSLNGSLGKDNLHNYYLGAAIYHIATPGISFRGQDQISKLTAKYSANLGANLQLGQNTGFLIHINYTNQKPYTETMAGALLSWRRPNPNDERYFVLYGGLFYRHKDAVIPTLKADYGRCSFTLSYDVNTSSAKQATNGFGGYEFSLFYKGFFPRQTESYNLRCPKFESMNQQF